MRSFILALSVLFFGCNTLSTQTPVNGVTRTDFDDRFHDGLQEVWDTCSEPLDLEPGDTSVSLLNGCTIANTATTEGDAVVVLLGAGDPISLSEPVPTSVFDEDASFDGFPWPLQNCEVTFDVAVDLNRLRLLNQETEWRLHDGKPSVHIDYDFPASAHVVDATITADVDCPSNLNEVSLQASIDLILPNNAVEVYLTGLDLDLDVELDHTETAISGDLDLSFQVGGIEVDTFIFDLANFIGVTDEELLESFGLTIDNLEDEVEPILEDSLSDLPDAVADSLMAAIPDGQIVCDVQIVNADDLRIVSDNPGPLDCVSLVPHQL